MLNDETRRKLRLLNIGEIIDPFEAQEKDPRILSMDFDERFSMLVDSLYQEKFNSKVQRLIKSARLRIPKADVHDILYHQDRPISRNLINELSAGHYINDARSIILQGFASTGKTYIACALAKEACKGLNRTRYIRVPDLLTEFEERSQEKGGKEKVLRKYAAFKVLVLDEWLIKDLTLEETQFLFELSERRFDTTSTIFCTLYKVEDWIPRLGGGTYAESITERYCHTAIRVETGSMNMRAVYAGEVRLS